MQKINQETDLLVIIDVQNDFCEGGNLAVAGADGAFVRDVAKFSKLFKNIVITQDWHPAGHSSFASSHEGREPFTQIDKPYGQDTLWPDHCVQNTHGSDLHFELFDKGVEERAALIIRKGMNPDIDSYSAFFENDKTTPTGLAGYVRERGFERIFFVGLAYDFCVAYSALDAQKIELPARQKMSGIQIPTVQAFVVEDLTCSISTETAAAAERQFEQAGVILCSSVDFEVTP